MTRTITTSISEEFYNYCKEKQIGWHFAISTGIKYLMDGKNVEQELKDTQDKLGRMSRVLAETNQRLWDLENKEKEGKK